MRAQIREDSAISTLTRSDDPLSQRTVVSEGCHADELVRRTRVGAGPAFYASAILIYAVSVAATFYFCDSMSGGMEMREGWTMSMMWMRMPGQSWLDSWGMFLLMWLAMMVAMMLPSAFPMLLTFHCSSAAVSTSRTALLTALVACGYFAVWMAVGIAVYPIGLFWASITMRWSALSFAVPALTGGALMLAGGFQFSRWKMTGLGHCRVPLVPHSPNRSSRSRISVLHGIRQGVSCAVCCSGPMLVLLVLGAMNPLVMTMIALVIASEKLLAKPQGFIRLTGILGIVSGAVIVTGSLLH